MSRPATRRDFLKTTASSSLALAATAGAALGEARPTEATLVSDQLPPVRALTGGPKHHWFGYYDKWEFDPTCRFVLGMEVEFEGRSPRADDVIKVGMVDTQDGDKWIEHPDPYAEFSNYHASWTMVFGSNETEVWFSSEVTGSGIVEEHETQKLDDLHTELTHTVIGYGKKGTVTWGKRPFEPPADTE